MSAAAVLELGGAQTMKLLDPLCELVGMLVDVLQLSWLEEDAQKTYEGLVLLMCIS